jgi:hypothetical protein
MNVGSGLGRFSPFKKDQTRELAHRLERRWEMCGRIRWDSRRTGRGERETDIDGMHARRLSLQCVCLVAPVWFSLLVLGLLCLAWSFYFSLLFKCICVEIKLFDVYCCSWLCGNGLLYGKSRVIYMILNKLQPFVPAIVFEKFMAWGYASFIWCVMYNIDGKI